MLHLAAQPLVRRSYAEPTATWATHVMGKIHLLEALRRLEAPCTAVLITTDNGYRNKEWLYGNRETIPSAAMTPTAAAARGRQPAAPDPPPSRCPRWQGDRLGRLGGRPDRVRCDAG